ncbi:MAG: DUF4136 domain-containing protein [Flammeovirgaceae bacterium]
MKNPISTAIIFIGLMASCSMRVHTSFDKRVNFSNYKKFCWLQGCEFTFTGPADWDDKKIKSLMENAVKNEMAKKGLVYDGENPQLLLDVHEAVETDTAFIYHRSGEEPLFMNFTPPQQLLLMKGTLIIDMIDKETGRMIWRSVATSYLDKNPELTEENFARGVAIALKKFPPKKRE